MAKKNHSSVKKTRNWTLAQKLAHYSRPGRQVPGVEGRCLEWTGYLHQDGYGELYWRGKKEKAHRLVWVKANGPMAPDKPHVLHRCDNPPCIRRKHLWAGTHADNMRDRAGKGRNDSRGERNGRAKLTIAQVREIRLGTGSQQAIGERYGVSQNTVSRIKNYVGWEEAGEP